VEEEKPAPNTEGAAPQPENAPTSSGNPNSARLSFRDWDALKQKLVSQVRRSERLTKEDLAIRINATD